MHMHAYVRFSELFCALVRIALDALHRGVPKADDI